MSHASETAPRATITVVSGLPRSGTSMAMAMLEAGGLPLLTDTQRPADASNPRGYYEYAPARRLRQDGAWLSEARGKGVKVISYLLDALPPGHHYRVIFMKRHLRQVLASQRAMLTRMGKPVGDDAALLIAIRKHLDHIRQWLSAQAHVDVLYVDYADAVGDPAAAAARIAGFIEQPLDAAAMAAAVDPSLYRER